MVLASDNLTYLPTPQTTTREQPFHTKHLPASYISRPYNGGWITDSHSPFAAPMIFVKKADGSLRLCVDFGPLNADTLKDRYPLPHMEDLLNEVHGSSHFTKLDLKSGYHQMRLQKEDREKTAFTTKYGLFEWTVVPFGLANAPSAVMRMMNKLLAKHRAYCVVYLDEIVILTSGGMDEHRAKVAAVVKTLRDDNWKLAPGKCVWGVAAVNFVGFLVNKDGIDVCKEMGFPYLL
jgi:hypothetical protein